MVKGNVSKLAAKENKKLTETKVEDFSIIELSTKKCAGKGGKNTVVCNRTQPKAKTKRELSVVDDYAEFDFRANKKRAAATLEQPEPVEKFSKEEIELALQDLKEILCIDASEYYYQSAKKAQKPAKKAKTCAKAKAEPEPKTLVVKDNRSHATIKNEPDRDFERQKPLFAEVSERILSDEAAERVINIARIGALFDCVKNY